MTKEYPIPLTKEQADAIIAEAEKSDDFDHMIFLTLKLTGRRIGELYGRRDQQEISRKIIGSKKIYKIDGTMEEVARTIPVYKRFSTYTYGVKVKDIDLVNGLMKVWVLKRRSYSQDETILAPELIRVIGVYIKKHRLELEDYLFRKKKRSLRNIQAVIKKYAKKAGVPIEETKEGVTYKLSPHSFRHYFITELKRRGWTSEQIIKLTGHKTIAVLSNYDHIVAKDLKDKALESIKTM